MESFSSLFSLFLFSDPRFYVQEVDAVARRRRWQEFDLKICSIAKTRHEAERRPRVTKWDDLTNWILLTWSGPSAGLGPRSVSELQRSPCCCCQRVGANGSFQVLQQEPILLITVAFIPSLTELHTEPTNETCVYFILLLKLSSYLKSMQTEVNV